MVKQLAKYCYVLPFVVLLSLGTVARGEESPKKAEKPEASSKDDDKSSDKSSSSTKSSSKHRPYDEVIKDYETIDGLIKTHKKGNRLLGEFGSKQLDKDFIVLISIAKGIGRGSMLGGMSWGFGDDWIWQFRKVDDRIHLVRRNVRFTADKADPQHRAIDLAYTDSVLFSLPILTTSPSGASVVDLTPVFMSDLPQISSVLPGFVFSDTKSTWAEGFPKGKNKGLTDNIELEVAATYSSSGRDDFDSVADSRGASIHVHYSISLLPAERLQAAAGRRSRGLLSHGGEGLVEEERRRPLRPLHQPLGFAEGRQLGQALASQEADHFLPRKDDSLRLPQTDSRRHRRMEQGL